MELPRTGRPADDVIAELESKRNGDARWQDGRTFGLVFDGGDSAREVAERAAALFLHENALNMAAFPSLAAIQSEVVAWTAALLHAGLPMKKFAMLQLSGRNLSGEEADRLGLVSAAVPGGELEAFTVTLAREIASRHPAVLQHAKIAVHLGRDIPLPQAMEVDRLVTARLRTAMDPTSTVDDYLGSQKGGTNTGYRRSDGAG